MDPNNEEVYYQKIYPAVWNQYKLLSGSISSYRGKYQMFLTFLGIMFLTFFELELYKNPYYLVPLVLLFINCFVAVYYLMPRLTWIPWIKKERFSKLLEEGDIKTFKAIYDDIFDVVSHVRDVQDYYKKGIRIIINLILLSMFSIPIIYYSLQQKFAVLIILWSGFWITLYFFNYKFNKPIKKD